MEEETHDKIKDFVKPQQITGATMSVLVNAIYFKGEWEKKFEKHLTRKRDFHSSDNDKMAVDFMHAKDFFRACDLNDFDATALEIKYAASKYAFIIVLPKNRTGLTALETQMKNVDLDGLFDGFDDPFKYDVIIPKFKVEFEINLNSALKNVRQTLYIILHTQTFIKCICFSVKLSFFTNFSCYFLLKELVTSSNHYQVETLN